jgi:hypothetical protein
MKGKGAYVGEVTFEHKVPVRKKPVTSSAYTPHQPGLKSQIQYSHENVVHAMVL